VAILPQINPTKGTRIFLNSKLPSSYNGFDSQSYMGLLVASDNRRIEELIGKDKERSGRDIIWSGILGFAWVN
jgi:hypothetical protein